jgi:hypothetical protein
MMDFVVNKQVIDDLKKEKEDKLGKTGLDELLKMWGGGTRSGSQKVEIDEHLLEMLSIEIEQLLVADESLHEFSHDDEISEDLALKIVDSKHASDFLKSVLKNRISSSNLGRTKLDIPQRLRPLYDLDSKSYGNIKYWSNQTAKISKLDVLDQEKNDVAHVFEISFENNDEYTRSSSVTLDIGFTNLESESSPLQLIEVILDDDTKVLKWIYADGLNEIVKGSRSEIGKYAYLPSDQRFVSFNRMSVKDSRGLGDWF